MTFKQKSYSKNPIFFENCQTYNQKKVYMKIIYMCNVDVYIFARNLGRFAPIFYFNF